MRGKQKGRIKRIAKEKLKIIKKRMRENKLIVKYRMKIQEID